LVRACLNRSTRPGCRAGCLWRSRWEIENETFNPRKAAGYHLEHSFGHGKQNLAAVPVTLNLLAFAFHTSCAKAELLWQAAGPKPPPGPGPSAGLLRSSQRNSAFPISD